MKRTRPFSCGLGPALDVITGKWKPTILWRLEEKPYRLSELRRSIDGITEKMLIEQLQDLEKHGIVARKDFQTLPLRVEYSLTDLGKDLNAILHPLAEWGKTYARQNGLTKTYQ